MTTNTMTTDAHSALHGAARTCRQVGVDLPAALEKEIADLDAVTVKLRPDHHSLAAKLVDAALAGKDGTTSAEAQRTATIAALRAAGVDDAVMGEVERRRVAAVVKHAEVILKSWAPAVEAAGAVLTGAVDVMPGIDIRDNNSASLLRPTRLALWGQAREALVTVERVAAGWIQLSQACRLARVDHRTKPLIVADLDAEQLAAVGHSLDPLQIVANGHRLSLADPDEFRRRVAAVKAAQETAAKDREDDRLTAQGEGEPRRARVAAVTP